MEDKKEAKNPVKRLILDIPLEYHTEVKTRAAQRNISLKLWVLRAIKDKIKSESQYE